LNKYIRKYNPAVKRELLFLLSGVMWSAVGILLNFFAFRWYSHFGQFYLVESLVVGLVLGLLIARFGFSRIVAKNISRTFSLPEKVCIFAFQEWKSYILILIMMSMGIYLRSHSILPKQIMAPMYMGIGLALFLSSFRYYKAFAKARESARQHNS